MTTGWELRAEFRARQYQQRIARKRRSGDFKGALDEAKKWVLSEMAHRLKRTPHQAEALYAEVTDGFIKLASQLPTYVVEAEETRDAAS